MNFEHWRVILKNHLKKYSESNHRKTNLRQSEKFKRIMKLITSLKENAIQNKFNDFKLIKILYSFINIFFNAMHLNKI